MLKTIALATALLVAAGPVLADGTPRLDQREARQVERIRQGWQSGELTRRETARLARGQAHLRRMAYRAKSDGEVTNRERARLHHEANLQSRHLFRQKHDRQSRNLRKAMRGPAPKGAGSPQIQPSRSSMTALKPPQISRLPSKGIAPGLNSEARRGSFITFALMRSRSRRDR